MNDMFDRMNDTLGKGVAFQRVLPVLGHLAKGALKPVNSQRPGEDIDEGLRVSLRTKQEIVYPVLRDYFGIQDINTEYITSGIPISLAFENVFDNVWVGRREVTNSKGQIGHDCQPIPIGMRNVLRNIPENTAGVILYRVTYDDQHKKHSETLYAPPEKTRIEYCDGSTCSPIILFRFHIRVGGLENHGIFGLSTGSVYDVGRLPKQLMYYDMLLREYGFPAGIRHIPLILERVEEHVTTSNPKTGTFKADKWLLSLRVDPEFLKICPIFSVPPLESIPMQKKIHRARISERMVLAIHDVLGLHTFPDEVLDYVEGVLSTGVYEKRRALYPVTDEWVHEVLLPRLYKKLDDMRQPVKVTQDVVEDTEDTNETEPLNTIEDTQEIDSPESDPTSETTDPTPAE